LVEHGVHKDRLSSKGFGSAEPIADNNTDEGREKNRRVEFTIVDPPAAGGATK
jgi:OOP family OmpA-OmpF porin